MAAGTISYAFTLAVRPWWYRSMSTSGPGHRNAVPPRKTRTPPKPTHGAEADALSHEDVLAELFDGDL